MNKKTDQEESFLFLFLFFSRVPFQTTARRILELQQSNHFINLCKKTQILWDRIKLSQDHQTYEYRYKNCNLNSYKIKWVGEELGKGIKAIESDVSRSWLSTSHSHAFSELNHISTKQGRDDQFRKASRSSLPFLLDPSYWAFSPNGISFLGKSFISFGLIISLYTSLKRKEPRFALRSDIFSSARALSKPSTNFR